jgi:hypothetical protein
VSSAAIASPLTLILADWWDPRTWLSSVANFFHGAFDAGTAIVNLSGAVLTILEQFFRFFFDTGHFIADVVKWATNAVFPQELQTWFLGTIGQPGETWNPTQVFEGLYQSMQAPALAIAAVCATGRITRGIVDDRFSAGHLLAAVLPRFLMAVAVIGVPGTHVAIGYEAIVWIVNSSMAAASQFFVLIFHVSLLQGASGDQGWFSHIYDVVANAGRDAVVVVLGGIPLLILILYALFLMVVRTVMLGFCIVTAPLCLATFAFDTQNRFFHWWFDIMLSVVMTPIIFSISIPLSITLASSVVSALAVGPILAIVMMCGGLWFSSKMVHHLTWRHFSHGSALAGFAAGASTVLGPLHKLATVGFMAEALGANRDGSHAAINFMKRVGLASQGFNPASGASPALLAAEGPTARMTINGPDVDAAGGPPDVTSSLSASGRSAVTGAEGVFNQAAFSAFAHSHKADVGALTRDQPYGSVSGGDRAKLAWNRYPPMRQTVFADDFLSHWLGSSAATDADTLDDREEAIRRGRTSRANV